MTINLSDAPAINTVNTADGAIECYMVPVPADYTFTFDEDEPELDIRIADMATIGTMSKAFAYLAQRGYKENQTNMRAYSNEQKAKMAAKGVNWETKAEERRRDFRLAVLNGTFDERAAVERLTPEERMTRDVIREYLTSILAKRNETLKAAGKAKETMPTGAEYTAYAKAAMENPKFKARVESEVKDRLNRAADLSVDLDFSALNAAAAAAPKAPAKAPKAPAETPKADGTTEAPTAPASESESLAANAKAANKAKTKGSKAA